jgi:hypothetical protein
VRREQMALSPYVTLPLQQLADIKVGGFSGFVLHRWRSHRERIEQLKPDLMARSTLI